MSYIFLGYPIFPGENELEQLGCIMEIFGQPPQLMLESCSRKKTFCGKFANTFNSDVCADMHGVSSSGFFE